MLVRKPIYGGFTDVVSGGFGRDCGGNGWFVSWGHGALSNVGVE